MNEESVGEAVEEKRERTMRKARKHPAPYGEGIIVSPRSTHNGVIFFAEVIPWGEEGTESEGWAYEVFHLTPDNPIRRCYAYEEGGSGGADTFYGCVKLAMNAVDQFLYRRVRQDTLQQNEEGKAAT